MSILAGTMCLPGTGADLQNGLQSRPILLTHYVVDLGWLAQHRLFILI